jgi:hypothetical protein
MRHVYRGHVRSLMRAITTLRVFESQWSDLEYPDGDPRKAIPDAEQPPELITERDRLRSEVTRYAALVGGCLPEEAEMYADDPLSPSNPFNLDRVRLAVAIVGGRF